MSKNLRVAILTTDNREHHRKYDLPRPYFGPAIEALLQGLAHRSALEIHVVSCTQRPMAAPEKLTDNIWFHLLHVPKIGWLRTGYQGCIRAARKKLKRLAPDIVHGQGTERDCAISAVFSGYPSLITIHGNMVPLAKLGRALPGSYAWCAAMLERITLPRTLGVLCNSSYTKSVVEKRTPRTWLVPNALREDFFEVPLPTGEQKMSPPVVVNIGTIAPHKRQLELLELAADLHNRGNSFELQFIGDVPKSAYAAKFFQRMRQPPYSAFAKHLNTKSVSQLIAELDQASSIIHVPSGEAFGLVVAEALSRNLKFFGAATGGVPDIATGVEGAELFKLDDQASITAAIESWLRNGCSQPRSAADEMRKRYHPDVIAVMHENIYREAVSVTASSGLERMTEA